MKVTQIWVIYFFYVHDIAFVLIEHFELNMSMLSWDLITQIVVV